MRTDSLTNQQAAGIPANLAIVASEPDIDPCDVAESAIPDLILGDLAPNDEHWVRSHTAHCTYCNNILESLEDVCSSLDECDAKLTPAIASRLPAITSCLGAPQAGYGFMESPVGDVLIARSDDGVVEVSYLRNHDRYESLRDIERRGFLVRERQQAVQPIVDQLVEYFAHERTGFDLPVDIRGVTPFTQSVLEATRQIPYGQVKTYGDVAATIGKPRASRAVGNALGRNPVPVIIPCHRVILSSGAMGWYTGGADIKRTLLDIEGVPAAQGGRVAQQSLLSDA